MKWDLLERKERLQLRSCSRAQKPAAHCSDEGWGFYGHFNSGLGVFFLLAVDSQAFSGELVWLAPSGGGGTILSILFISPVADLSDPVSLPQNAEMQFITPSWDAETIVLSMRDGILTHLP
jgi:hypothetical protein